MIKHLQMLLSLCFVLSIMFASLSTTGYACSCVISPPPDQALKQAKAVFAGKVVSVKEDRQNYQKEVVFEVAKTWKGINQTQVEVTTALDSAACGYGFEIGQEYLVYAHQGEEDELQTSLCSRTAELGSAKEDLAVLGEGKAPTEEVKIDSNYQSANMYVAISVGVVVGIVALFAWRSLRR